MFFSLSATPTLFVCVCSKISIKPSSTLLLSGSYELCLLLPHVTFQKFIQRLLESADCGRMVGLIRNQVVES
mgnify:CR=1 FL=1